MVRLLLVAAAWGAPSSSALLLQRKEVVARRAATIVAASVVEESSFAPLYDFASASAAEGWERIDDVVMGGVSSSRLTHIAESTKWCGTVRTDGGGFCGARTAAFESPVDLSAYDGVYVEAALLSDDEPERRAWKLTLRCGSDRGEVVHSAEWIPPVDQKSRVCVPFNKFRLVRGPRLVPGAPPLTSENCTAVYGLGMTISKFKACEDMMVVEDFRDGPFTLELSGIGGYSSGLAPALTQPKARQKDPSRDNSAGNSLKGAGRLAMSFLRPLADFAFAEKRRRRKQARSLLVRSSKCETDLDARLWGQRVVKRGVKGQTAARARADGFGELSRDALSTAISFPLKLAFRALFTIVALAKKWQQQQRGTTPEKLPSLTAA